MNDSLPAGWYTDESGSRKYWTGTEWIVPTAQDPAEQELAKTPASAEDELTELASQTDQYEVPSSKKPRKKAAIIAGMIAALLVFGGGGTWYVIDKNNKAEAVRVAEEKAAAEERAAEEAKVKAEMAAAAERKRESDQRAEQARRELAAFEAAEAARKENDEFMENQTPSWHVAKSGDVYFRFLEDDEYSCGTLGCTGVAVHSYEGCPSGVYVQASLLQNELVVGYTNGRIGHLEAGESGAEVMQFSVPGQVVVRIDEVNCY